MLFKRTFTALLGVTAVLAGSVWTPQASWATAPTSAYASVLPDASSLTTPGSPYLVSSTGQYVVFAGDGVNSFHTYWRDTTSGVTKRIDYATDGSDPGASSLAVPQALTADGRYVLLLDSDPAMQPGQVTTQGRLFMRDTTNDTTTRILLGNAGAEENAAIEAANLTPDGRYLTFLTSATNLFPSAGQPGDNVYLRDTTDGSTTLSSRTTDGLAPNGQILAPVEASTDGHLVAYSSAASNLAFSDTNGKIDVFQDTPGQYPSIASVTITGAGGNGDSFFRGQSADGHEVVFDSDASNLVANNEDTNGARDVFRFQRDYTTVTRVSVNGSLQGGTDGSISADGRYVAFQSPLALSSADGNGISDCYVVDMKTAVPSRVSRSSTDGDPDASSVMPRISGDGSHVLYGTSATNIDANHAESGLQLASLDHTPPAGVTNLTAKAGSGLVKLTWTNPATAFARVVVVYYTGNLVPPDPVSGRVAYSGTGNTVTVSGLVNGTFYTFSVFVEDADGNPSSGAVTEGQPRAPLYSTLKLAPATSTVNYGGGLNAIATLLDTYGQPLGGEPVAFYWRKKGTTTFSLLGTQTTAANGTTARLIKPAWNAEIQVRHAATPYYAASTSPLATMYVRPTLSPLLSNATALLGTASSLHGTVAPNHAGQLIYLQRYYSSAWHTLTSVKIGTTGGYAFGIKPTISGVYSYRVFKPADSDHVAVATGTFKVTRYAAKIATVHYDAAGNDFTNLNDEYLVLTNTGHVTINLSGWRLYAGDSTQNYTLPSYGLAAGASVRIHTGHGTNGSGNLYLGLNVPIWNNSGGDTAIVYDARGAVVSKYTY